MAAMPRSSLTPTAMPGRSHTTRDSLSRKMTHSPSRTSARRSHPDWTLDTLTVRSGGFGRWRTVGVAYGQPCETVRETGAGQSDVASRILLLLSAVVRGCSGGGVID